MKYLMGVDIGTKSVKTVVYDFYGNPVANSSFDYNIEYFIEPRHPEWAFVDPQKLWNSVVQSISDAIKDIDNKEDILSLAVTGIGMDGLPVDKHGKPLYPIISWHCSRTEPQCKRWLEELGREKIFSITGRQVLNIDSIYRIMWVKENLPEVYNKTYKWLLIEDFINYRLCGEMVTDYSMASTTSVFDQRTKGWSDELLSLAQVDKAIMPGLSASGCVLGHVTDKAAELIGLSSKTMVVLGGHDYLCAAFSLGTNRHNSIIDITGSWEMIILPVGKHMLSDKTFNAGLKVESHVDADKYVIVGDAVSTNMLDWFKELFIDNHNSIKKWNNLLKQAVDCEPGASGIFFLPHCSGAGCPKPDTRSSGSFVGLHDLVTKEIMLRSVIEGLNYQFKDMIVAVETGLDNVISDIIAVGYESKNEFFMQNKADITGKAIYVPNILSATCLGAAILAGLGCGVYKNEVEVRNNISSENKVYSPRQSIHSKYLQYYEVYKQIYPTLKTINWQIFDIFRS